MASSPVDAGFSVTRKGYDPAEVDAAVDEFRHRGESFESRITTLQEQIKDAEQLAAHTAAQLEDERGRNAAFAEELRGAREQEEAVRLVLIEATKTKKAMLAEAEQVLDSARSYAQHAADEITVDAGVEAESIVADARRQAADISEAGRSKVAQLEAESAQRTNDLADEQQRVIERLDLINGFYDELQATLTLVAETAIADLADTQDSVNRELQHQSAIEANPEQADSGNQPGGNLNAPETYSGRVDGVPPSSDNTHGDGERGKTLIDSTPPPATEDPEPDPPRVASPAIAARLVDDPVSGPEDEQTLISAPEDEPEKQSPELPRLGEEAARGAHDLARSLRQTFST